MIQEVAVLSLFLCCVQSEPSWAPEENTKFWYNHGEQTLRKQLDKQFDRGPAKNAVLFLGDGMGVPTITAGRIRYGQRLGQLGESYVTTIDELPYVGLSKTYNIDYQTPDSAGTATAYLCGVKARSGTIGVNGHCIRSDCTKCLNQSVESIMYSAKRAGKSTGVVTTTRVTHASPAGAYANIPDREWETYDNKKFTDTQWKQGCRDIAYQLVQQYDLIDVVIGGGRANFLPNTTRDPEYSNITGNRVDGRNLVDEWIVKASGRYGNRARYVWSNKDFQALDTRGVDKLLALLEPSHMPYEAEREMKGGDEPSLANMTAKAIEILSKNPNGFVLFVEGGRIDHGHHGNLAHFSLDDYVAFDDAIRTCKEMVGNDKTQIVVTADHSHVFTFGGYSYRNADILGFATYKKTNSSDVDMEPFTSILYGNGPGYIETSVRRNETYWKLINVTALDYRYQTAVPLVSETHGGEDVAILAGGPRAHLYSGVIEQSDIFHIMLFSLCMDMYSNDPKCFED